MALEYFPNQPSGVIVRVTPKPKPPYRHNPKLNGSYVLSETTHSTTGANFTNIMSLACLLSVEMLWATPLAVVAAASNANKKHRYSIVFRDRASHFRHHSNNRPPRPIQPPGLSTAAAPRTLGPAAPSKYKTPSSSRAANPAGQIPLVDRESIITTHNNVPHTFFPVPLLDLRPHTRTFL